MAAKFLMAYGLVIAVCMACAAAYATEWYEDPELDWGDQPGWFVTLEGGGSYGSVYDFDDVKWVYPTTSDLEMRIRAKVERWASSSWCDADSWSFIVTDAGTTRVLNEFSQTVKCNNLCYFYMQESFGTDLVDKNGTNDFNALPMKDSGGNRLAGWSPNPNPPASPNLNEDPLPTTWNFSGEYTAMAFAAAGGYYKDRIEFTCEPGETTINISASADPADDQATGIYLFSWTYGIRPEL